MNIDRRLRTLMIVACWCLFVWWLVGWGNTCSGYAYGNDATKNIVISRDLWLKTMKKLAHLKTKVNTQAAELDAYRKKRAVEDESCKKFILQERIICSKRSKSDNKNVLMCNVALAVCGVGIVGALLGGYHIGKDTN